MSDTQEQLQEQLSKTAGKQIFEVPESYEIIYTKTGRPRVQKILSEEEKQKRIKTMQEGKKAKRAQKKKDEEELKSLRQEKSLAQTKKQQEKQLTRDDIKQILEEYASEKILVSKEATYKQQKQKETSEKDLPLQSGKEEAVESSPKTIQKVKKYKHIQRVVKSNHPLIPDEVIDEEITDSSV